jgi:secondary thiamine-phosphate synthase enzyme
MLEVIEKSILTAQYNEMINITQDIKEELERHEIQEGFITIQTMHTTTGITVNESLECLEQDIEDLLSQLVPEEKPYHHARMLRDYGSTAGNATGHLKSFMCGNHCHFALKNGQLLMGSAQQVYFCEFDGPAKRNYTIIINTA